MAAGIVDGLALLNGLSTEGVVLHQQRATRAVHFYFERYCQRLAVAKHGSVDRGKPRWTCVEVAVRLPCGGLPGSIGKFDGGAVTHRPVAAAWTAARFQYRTGIAEFAHLVGCYQS